ncbi:MAG: hypothetical protein AB1568_06585 [Thermodesulfobacteriota bacterium]
MLRRLAIDIGEEKVTAVLHRRALAGREVLASASVAVVADLDGALARLLAQLGPSSPAGLGVDCAIPLGEASLRFLRFPFCDRRKINRILPLELENQLPWGHDAIQTATVVVDRGKGGCEVLAAALPRTTLQRYQETLARHGLFPGRLLLSPLPLFYRLRQQALLPDDSVLLYRCGGTVEVAVVSRGKLAALRSLHTGGDDGATGRLLGGLRQILKGVEVRSGGVAPANLIAVGWPQADADLAEEVRRDLAVPVHWLESGQMVEHACGRRGWRGWRGGCAVIADAQSAACLALAASAGGARLPCFPLETASGSGPTLQVRRKLLPASLILIGLTVLWGGNALLDRAILEKRLALLDGGIREVFYQLMPADAKLVDPVLQLQALLAEKAGQGMAGGTGLPREKILDVLLFISASLDGAEKTVVSSLSIDQEEILLRGEAASFNAVDGFKARLEKEPSVAEATITAANMDGSGRKVLFELRLRRRAAVS